jgi:site-specific recombinase XerD
MKHYEIIMEKLIKKIVAQSSKHNSSFILDFMEKDKALGVGVGRRANELWQLLRISQLLKKDFKDVSRKDLIEVMNALRLGREKKYSENYINQYKMTLIKFFVWMGRSDVVKDADGKNADFLRTKQGKKISVNSKDILTEKEIVEIVQACDNLRNKAFLHLCYETGARLNEIRYLRRKDIRIESDQAIITLRTEKNPHENEREVPVVYCVPDIILYLNSMRDKSKDAFLWVGAHGDILSEDAFRNFFGKAAKKAGIEKRVWIHLLRHSRCSHTSPLIPESIQRRMFGWAANSPMPSHYTHLSSAKVNETILGKLYGIENAANGKTDAFCSRCKAKVQEGTDICWRCNMILDEKKKLETERETRELADMKTKLDNIDFYINEKVKEILAKTGEKVKA